MQRFLLPLLVVALVVPLFLAAGAQARISQDGRKFASPPHGRGGVIIVTPAVAVERAELTAYLADVAPVYAQLYECSCCCDKLDLPSHRCAACSSAAAKINQVVARVERAQRQLAGVNVPASLETAQGEIVLAADTMHVSGHYMARTVSTTPAKLVTATFVSPPRGRGGVIIVMRPSLSIVTAARSAALFGSTPKSVTQVSNLQQRRENLARMTAYSGTTGQTAQQYLTIWRTLVENQAEAAGMTLPADITD
jgi:hypothetical protein